MAIDVTLVKDVTPELADAVNKLLSQLSSAAKELSQGDVDEIVKSEASSLFIAATENGNVVGMLTLATFKIPTGVRALIEDVVVDRAAQGSGVGSALCAAAIECARSAGAVSVDLTSRPSRIAANRLYQKLGFQQRETNVYRYTS
jgi:ribosomal protein S18 acetylase RimI-like enzyme